MERVETQRTQTWIVTAAVAIAGFFMGSIAIGHVMGDLGNGVLGVGACTALLSAIAVRLALRVSRTPRTAAGAAVGFTLLAATLNSPLSFVALSLFDRRSFGEPFGVVAAALLAFVVGLVFTVPLGLVFAAAYAPLVGAVQRPATEPSCESLEVAVRATGLWLAIVGVCSSIGVVPFFFDRHLSAGVSWALIVVTLAAAAIGALAAAVATLRIARRRRWFARVLEGLEPEWSIVHDAGDVPVSAAIRPLFLSPDPADGFLVRRVSGVASGAYRTGEGMEPVARV